MGYTCQTIFKNIQIAFRNGRKCHDTQLYAFTVCLKKTPERVNRQRGGKVGVFYFIHFTVLKDVGDTMNLSALPSSGIKHVYCTCGTFIYFFCLTCLLRDELARGLFYSWSDRSVQRNKRFDSLFLLALILHNYCFMY